MHPIIIDFNILLILNINFKIIQKKYQEQYNLFHYYNNIHF